MLSLEVTFEELTIIEEAVEKFALDRDEYLDVLDDLHFEGLDETSMDEAAYEDAYRDLDIANVLLDQIDDLLYISEDWLDPWDDWYDDVDLNWDDVDESAVELEVLSNG